MKKVPLLIAIFFITGVFTAMSVPQRSAEATAEVPALDSFHEVIFKIWHEAWPKKDAALLKQLAPDRLCFGSHAPFYYFESAQLKLQESDLSPEQLAAITHDNARKLLA